MPNESIPEKTLVEAHRDCTLNADALDASEICGCFYCLSTFAPAEVSDWIDDTIHGKEGRTALCPMRAC